MIRTRCIRKGLGILLLIIFMAPLQADEGMWLLPLLAELNIERMEQIGCELSAAEIYSHDTVSLKNMIGSLDHGSCTAGLISGEGLILTNHHCGEEAIQSHSLPGRDYLSEGFWAASAEEELPNPGKTISFVVRMEDVTERVLAMVHHEMTETERDREIEEVSEEIISEAIEETHYEAEVLPFYEGNRYYLIVLETFRDVRLVAAPPESIGSFGGDDDNWEWPRHNADFCLMRIYTAPDGSPADYSPGNIPFRTEHFLPISMRGYEEDDFTMVLGFPGTTERYLTSERVKEISEIENANRIIIRGTALEILDREMSSSDRIRIQYTAKHSRLSNYYKYSIGQNKSIHRLDVGQRRLQQEDEFRRWADGDSLLRKEYYEAVDEMNAVIRERREMENALSYLEEVFLGEAMEIFGMAVKALPLYFNGLGFNPEEDNRDELLLELKDEAMEFYRNFNPPTDKKLALELIRLYENHVEPIYFPGIYSSIYGKYKGNLNKYLDKLYGKSIFADSIRFTKYMSDPDHDKLIKDPAFQGAFGVVSTYFQILDEYEELGEKYTAASRKFQAGLQEMYPDSSFYPDANSTLRLSYGTISGYVPRDAVSYDYFTTLDGIMEKEDPGSRQFTVPVKLAGLHRLKSYHPYSNDSIMRVCFLTNLDTSGGNSGSPVLNGRGEVVGLNFDGNWESMSGDLIFEPYYQRSICVDIRYILFLIDRFGDAGYLIEEMVLND